MYMYNVEEEILVINFVFTFKFLKILNKQIPITIINGFIVTAHLNILLDNWGT